MSNSSDTKPTSDFRPAEWFGEIKGHHFLIGLICFFGMIFLVNGVLAYFALSTFDGIENPQANRNGKNFREIQQNAQAQVALGWDTQFDTRVEKIGDTLALTIIATLHDSSQTPLDGLTTTIALWHPTTQKMDVTRPMTPLGNGQYRASLPLGQLGNWNLRIIAGDLTTQKYSHQERIFLKP